MFLALDKSEILTDFNVHSPENTTSLLFLFFVNPHMLSDKSELEITESAGLYFSVTPADLQQVPIPRSSRFPAV